MKVFDGLYWRIYSNKKNRTFTIVSMQKGQETYKYRTVPFSQSNFEEAQNWLSDDWVDFMRYTDDYYPI